LLCQLYFNFKKKKKTQNSHHANFHEAKKVISNEKIC
jgi:hypothetical protein